MAPQPQIAHLSHMPSADFSKNPFFIKKWGWTISVLLMLVCFPAMSHSEESPEEKGARIAYKLEEQFDNYGDTVVNMTMHLHKNGKKVISRETSLKLLQTEENTDKLLMQFHSPADVKGVSLLGWTHKDQFDDLWMYIPDLRRVKRISSQAKGSEFMGSEFQTEDLIRPEPEKYDYKWLEDKPCGERECYLVDRYPKETSSIYSRQVLWIQKQPFRIHKMVSYDKSGKKVKSLEFFDFTLYENKFWRWGAHKLTDHRTGEVTHSEFTDWKFNTGLKESLFTVNGLKNIR